MTLKEHKKHTALARPQTGVFGRNEWAILGAPCGTVENLARKIITELAGAAKIAYVDARHNDEENAPLNAAFDTQMIYTQTLAGPQVKFSEDLNKFQRNALFKSCDLVLINGNHHQADKQVVIINATKKTSLQKRLNQLTNVGLFLLDEDETELFDFIKTAVPGWEQIAVLRLSETDRIVRFFNDQLASAIAPMKGLVLAGGKSERMGTDKGLINFHGQPQRYYVADLLKQFTDDVFISCRAEQQQEVATAYNTLPDTFTNLGPFGAILSAFRQEPETAWLVAACDLPLLDAPTLSYLKTNRNPWAIATAFISEHDRFPEPLITIWEPKSYPVLLSFLSQGYSCPRKVLINSNTHLLQLPDTAALTNVNTPQELETVQSLLQNKSIDTQ